MIQCKHKLGIVIVTADDGTTSEWPLATFEADPAAAVAATGNGITPPEPELSPEQQKIAELEKRNKALEAVLIDKGLVVKTEIDEKVLVVRAEVREARSSYVKTEGGMIALVRDGAVVVTFDPQEKGPDQDAYNAWLAGGGVPL
jgi:hypothetical protein